MADKPYKRFQNRGPKTLGLGERGHLNLGLGLGLDFQDGFRFHDELIADRGEIVIHEMAVACPKCRSGDVDDPVIRFSDCTNCEGGFLYRNPRRIQALVTSISSTRDLTEIGFAVPGDCVLSTRPNERPQVDDFDKITFTWPQPISDGQVLVRGSDYQRYTEKGGRYEIEANEDLLHYAAENALHVEDEDGTEYFQDSDFIFDNKIIRWVGNAPIIRKRYVVKYEAYLEWIVILPPFQRRDKGRNLGPRVVLRKVHTFRSTDDPNKDSAQEKATLNTFGGKIRV